MDDDERMYGDADTRAEMIDARRKWAAIRRRARAWDEPPDYYDDDPEEAETGED